MRTPSGLRLGDRDDYFIAAFPRGLEGIVVPENERDSVGVSVRLYDHTRHP